MFYWGSARVNEAQLARNEVSFRGVHFANSGPKPLISLRRGPFETKRNGFLKREKTLKYREAAAPHRTFSRKGPKGSPVCLAWPVSTLIWPLQVFYRGQDSRSNK